MFQDSVPAGSYNDPFLSSVCVCVCVKVVCERERVKKLCVMCERWCVTKWCVKDGVAKDGM